MNTGSKTGILSVIAGLALVPAPGHAQTNGPLVVQWQQTYGGGPGTEHGSWLSSFCEMPDGGFLLFGSSDGPVNTIRTPPIWSHDGMGDYWAIKIDGSGHRLWDKSYAGFRPPPDFAGEAFGMTSLLLPDGGFLLGGTSLFDTPGATRTAPRTGGAVDVWLLRCDVAGNVLWDLAYGSRPSVSLSWLGRTPDGGFFLVGTSAISPNFGAGEIWVARLDSQGSQLWELSLGGDSDFDFASSACVLPDGGLVVAGTSASPPGTGNKTSPFFGAPQLVPALWYSGSDGWVVRLDANGHVVWDKSYGGSRYDYFGDIRPTADGGFLLVGASDSPPVDPATPERGNKHSPRYGVQDFWAVRIDGAGNVLWERTYGGSLADRGYSALSMPDGGWLLSGLSASAPGETGTKTSPRYGGNDVWLVRIDEQGNPLWNQSFGGPGQDVNVGDPMNVDLWCRAPIEHTKDGGFLLATTSFSAPGGAKTSPKIGTADYWVLKLGPEPPSLQASFTAEGHCKLRLIGPPQFAHAIQGSDDLRTWKELVVLSATAAGKTDWVDPEKGAHRFYRARRN